MKKNDRVYTPRFCSVIIEEVFGSRAEAARAGYTEPTHYHEAGWGIAGKPLDEYHMVFAAYQE